MPKRTRTKGQRTIYKPLHRKLKIEQHDALSASPEGTLVPAPLVIAACYCSTIQK
jgi:hypothetical protein